MLRYGGIWINSKGIEKKKKEKGKTQQSSQFYFMKKKTPFLKKERK